MTAEAHFLPAHPASTPCQPWGLTGTRTEPVPTTGLKGQESLSLLLPGPGVCRSRPTISHSSSVRWNISVRPLDEFILACPGGKPRSWSPPPTKSDSTIPLIQSSVPFWMQKHNTGVLFEVTSHFSARAQAFCLYERIHIAQTQRK